jgi:hypothetical protein
MRFNSSWSPPFRFTAGIDNPRVVENWGCRGKAGVYVISNWNDTNVLYVGKAEATSRDICHRLAAHLSGIPPAGNRRIANLVGQGESFTVRWAESRNPALSEAIAIIQLAPHCNSRCEWKELVDRTSDEDCLREAGRLGLISVDPFRKIAERIVLAMREQTQQERVTPLWERETTQQERLTPLWERSATPNQERNTYRER